MIPNHNFVMGLSILLIVSGCIVFPGVYGGGGGHRGHGGGHGGHYGHGGGGGGRGHHHGGGGGGQWGHRNNQFNQYRRYPQQYYGGLGGLQGGWQTPYYPYLGGSGIIGGGGNPPILIPTPTDPHQSVILPNNTATPTSNKTATTATPSTEKAPTIIHIHHNYPNNNNYPTKNVGSDEVLVDEAGPISQEDPSTSQNDKMANKNPVGDEEFTDFDLSLIDARSSVK